MARRTLPSSRPFPPATLASDDAPVASRAHSATPVHTSASSGSTGKSSTAANRKTSTSSSPLTASGSKAAGPGAGRAMVRKRDVVVKVTTSSGYAGTVKAADSVEVRVDNAVQQWVKALPANELSAAMSSRINGLLTRYKGKFQHYDVNNEMLHGSFYQDKLGKDARATMFNTASKLDPDALLYAPRRPLERIVWRKRTRK
uniref:GH10 domain-containing protein n=1 Tax=Oryza meridionalis TaxID=40149 RepID=A0A0E0DIB5_9ORYZ